MVESGDMVLHVQYLGTGLEMGRIDQETFQRRRSRSGAIQRELK